MCVSVCACVLDSLVTQGGLMAIQGLCPFSWSMGLNLACGGEGGGGGGKEEKEEEKRAEEECKNEVEVVRRGSCSQALINISPY